MVRLISADAVVASAIVEIFSKVLKTRSNCLGWMCLVNVRDFLSFSKSTTWAKATHVCVTCRYCAAACLLRPRVPLATTAYRHVRRTFYQSPPFSNHGTVPRCYGHIAVPCHERFSCFRHCHHALALSHDERDTQQHQHQHQQHRSKQESADIKLTSTSYSPNFFLP